MFAEWYKPGCLLEYPLGGTGAIIDALVSGIEKFGGRLALRSHVEKILIENGRAVGVKLQSGQVSSRRYFIGRQNKILPLQNQKKRERERDMWGNE
jgi:phytoene dehydrogenase-like protein